jgi:uncharacterized membrane protein YhdT
MKIVVGVILTLVGALWTLVATPYAIIVAMMSGFSDDPATLIVCCAVVPLLGIGVLAAGIRTTYCEAKSDKSEKMKTKPNNAMERSRILVTDRANARSAPSIRLAHLRR